jgi:hypothetical protein
MDNRRGWPIVVVGSLTLNEIPVHLVPLSLGITILPGPHPLLPNLFGGRHIIPVICLANQFPEAFQAHSI